MGDADSQQPDAGGNDLERMTGMLDALDEDLSHLHHTVNDLEERTLRAVHLQLKSYEDFRYFFVALNVIALPILISIGFCYGLQEVFTTDASKTMLQSLTMILLFLSGSVGIPLYLGALLAVWKFRVPLDFYTDEFFRALQGDVEEVEEDNFGISRRNSSGDLTGDSLDLMGVSEENIYGILDDDMEPTVQECLTEPQVRGVLIEEIPFSDTLTEFVDIRGAMETEAPLFPLIRVCEKNMAFNKGERIEEEILLTD